MIVSDNCKYIYMGCQKTASTTIRRELCKRSQDAVLPKHKMYGQHWTALAVRDEYVKNPDKWNSYFKFAFVRNPWDREVSFYAFKKGHGAKKGLQKKDTDKFKKFVMTYTDSPCWKFVTDNEYNQIIDFVGRYETLQEDFNKICNRLNWDNIILPIKLQSKYRTGHHYTEFYLKKNGEYDEELIEMVHEKWKKDVELFNYIFERPKKMKVDYFYNGISYGSEETNILPKIGDIVKDKRITEVDDLRDVPTLEHENPVVEVDIFVRLEDYE